MTEGTPAASTPSTTPTPTTTAPAPAAAPSSPTHVQMPTRPAATPDSAPNAPATAPAASLPPAATEGAPGAETPPAAPTDHNTTTAAATDFKVPDEYKDKAWAGKVKTQDDLWKQLANAQELIGKKSVVPDLAKATPEEREAYYAQLRPASADEYVFPDTGMPMPPEMKTTVTDMFMKNGVSAVQANDIIKAYQDMGNKQLAAMYDPKEFETTLETAFGKDWKAVTGTVRNSLKGMMSEADQKALDNLPNAYLATVYRTLGNVVQKFGVKETPGAHFEAPGTAANTDINAVRDGLRKQMSAMSSRPHTAQELATLRTQLADTYKNDPRLAQGA